MTTMAVQISTPIDMLAALPQVTGVRLDDGQPRMIVAAISNHRFLGAGLLELSDAEPDRIHESTEDIVAQFDRLPDPIDGILFYAITNDMTLSVAIAFMLSDIPHTDIIAVWGNHAVSVVNQRPHEAVEFTYGNAELTYAGMAPCTRAEIVAPLAADPAWIGKVPLTTERVTLVRWAKAWHPVLSGKDVDLDDVNVLSTLGASLADRGQRDSIVWWVSDALPYSVVEEYATFLPKRPALSDLPAEDLTTVVARLTTIAQRMPDAYAADVWAILANHHYVLRGDGIRTRACVDAALAADPDHVLSLLMRRMVDEGIRPQKG